MSLEQDARIEALQAELDRYRQLELAAQHKIRQAALARAARRRAWALAVPLASSVITPVLLAILLMLQMCGCQRGLVPPAPMPPTTMQLPVGQLIRSDGAGCTVWKAGDDLAVTAGHCCAELDKNGAPISYTIRRTPIVEGTDVSVLIDDDENDICVLRAYIVGQPLELASRDPEIGAFVMTAGYPRGWYVRSIGLWSGRFSSVIDGKVETGSVSSTYAQPGASGSPVIDAQGRVVGLLKSCGTEPDGAHIMELVNISAPVEKIRAAVKQAQAL